MPEETNEDASNSNNTLEETTLRNKRKQERKGQVKKEL
jgi:hypothetical protein